MFYVFAYLSVFSPTILLQTRVLDTPLAPTIGALPICLANVCAVFPRPGTTLHDFVQDIPRPSFPAINATPPARVIIPDGTEGDGGGSGGRLDWSEKSPHTLPLLAQKLHRSNVEPFTWDAFQESDIRFITSAFPHRNFPRTVYPLDTAAKLNPDIPLTGHSDRVISLNHTPPPDLWSDRDNYLALSSSSGLGRKGSMNDWHNGSTLNHRITTNGTTNHPTHHLPHRLVTTLGDIELPSLSLVNRTGALPRTISMSNTTSQFNLAIGPIAIGLKVELKYPRLSPPQHLLSGRETSLVISNFGSLGRGRPVFSWDLGRIRSVLKWFFGRRNVVSHAKRRPRPSLSYTRRLFKIRLRFKTAHLPAQPQCLASQGAFYLLSETCPIDGAADGSLQDPPSSTPAAADWPFFGLPQCLLSDKALYLRNDICLNPVPPPPLAKPAVGSHAALGPFTSIFKAIFGAIPFRPISAHSLPCLTPHKDMNCGFYNAPPSLDMALEWDIRSQAALVAQNTPTFLTMVPDLELPTCRKHRGFSFDANVCSPPPASRLHKSFIASPHLFPIRMRYIIVIALAVLGKAISLAKRDRQLERWFTLAVALAALGQAFSLAKFKRFEGRDTRAPPAVHKPKEVPAKTGVAVTLTTLRQTFSLARFRIFERPVSKAPPAVPKVKKLEEVKKVVTATLVSLGEAFSSAKFRIFERPSRTKDPPAAPKDDKLEEMVFATLASLGQPLPLANFERFEGAKDSPATLMVKKLREMKPVATAALAILGRAFSLAKFKTPERPSTKAPPTVPKVNKLKEMKMSATATLASLGLPLVKFERFERPSRAKAPPAVPKLEEIPLKTVVDETVDIDVPEYVPALPTPKPTPSPTKGKARMVAGRRVQPARKSKKPSTSVPASGLESSSSTGSVAGKGRSPKRSKRT